MTRAVGELITTVLNDVSGWSATVTPDAAVALAAFRQVVIQVLLLDINLPGISGLELLALLRDDPTWHDPAVILMSADPGQPGIRQAVDQQLVDAFLPKPLDLDVLIATIAGTLRMCVDQALHRARSGGLSE